MFFERFSEHRVYHTREFGSFGRGSEHMQAVGHGSTLEFFQQVAKLVQENILKAQFIFGKAHVQLAVKPEFHGKVQDFCLMHLHEFLFHAHVNGIRIVEDGSVELCVFPVKPGFQDRRDQVVDDNGITSAFGLDTFPEPVHDIGIDNRDVPVHQGRPVFTGKTELFARQPFHGPVPAHVHHCISSVFVLEPEVEGNVLVVRRQVLGMVEGIIVLQPAPCRLGSKNYPFSDFDLRDYKVFFSP